MKLSNLDAGKEIKLLGYGESGAGKTCGMASFPGPMYVFDFDGKISSAARFYKNQPQVINEIEYDQYLYDEQDKAKPFKNFKEKLISLKKDCKYSTVGLDSITLFSDRLMDYLVATNSSIKRTHQGQPALQDYMLFSSAFRTILQTLLALPCHVIMTAHLEKTKDDTTGEILRQPLVLGKASQPVLPILFNEVYRIHVRDGKYLAQTKSDSQYNCRSQLNGAPKDIPFTFQELKKYV